MWSCDCPRNSDCFLWNLVLGVCNKVVRRISFQLFSCWFPSYNLHQGFSTGVPRDVARGSARDRDWKNKHHLLNLLAKINRSTEKYHSLLKRALITIIGLLYLQLTDHANVPWAVHILMFMQGFPETWKLFQLFLQGKKIEKGCYRRKVWTE
jgi:hypothetical protein